MKILSTLPGLVRGRANETLEERNARNLILSGAWLGFIDGGIMTYLGVWLARLGATPAIMGLLASGPQLVNVLAMLPAGMFVERQKNMVSLANRVAIIHRSSYVLIALLPLVLPAESIPLAAIAIWSLAVIPSALHMPALMSVVQIAVPPERRPSVNAARWGLYCAVGAVVIPLVGVMTDRVSFPVGYQLAFVLSFVGSLPNIYFFSRITLPPFKGQHEQTPAARPLLARLREFVAPFVESKGFVRFNVATAMFRIALTMPAGLFSIFWVDYLNAPDTWIGVRGAVAYAALVVGYWVFGKITNRIGHRNLLFLSALIGFYPITTALSPSVEWLLPAAVIWGICVAAIDIGVVDMLLAACPKGRQPTFIAVANVLASVENFTGPLIGAALAEAIGVPEALLAAGALQVVSGVFFLLFPSRDEERRERLAAAQAVQPES
jgi:MFS family permease